MDTETIAYLIVIIAMIAFGISELNYGCNRRIVMDTLLGCWHEIKSFLRSPKRHIRQRRINKNRELISRGYGFLLRAEDKEEALSDGSIEILKPFQQGKILRGAGVPLTEQSALRSYARMMNTLHIGDFENILSDDFCYTSQMVLESLNNKQKFMDYIFPKLRAIKNSDSVVFAEMGSIVAYQGYEEPCVILAQPTKDNLVGVVLAEVKNNQLTKLDLCIVPPSENAHRTGDYPS